RQGPAARQRLRRRRGLLRREDARDGQPVQRRTRARARCGRLRVAEPLTILLVGGGGREHALVWRLRQENPSCRILAAPGNPGIGELATCAPVRATDVPGLVALARQERVDWTLVGPEAPLAAGLADAFRAESMPIFGPTKAAAAIESSKAFSKEVMFAAGV